MFQHLVSLLVYCKKYGELFGFHLMKYVESSRTVHELLTTRWAKTPREVIYDNSCNTFKFVHHRDPHFYKDTVFFIVKLHVKGHVKCSPAFSRYMYSWLARFNSQVCDVGLLVVVIVVSVYIVFLTLCVW